MSYIEWAEKYRPKRLREVIGNRNALKELKEWAEEQELQKNSKSKSKFKKAVILYGPPGSGKTSAAYALAAEREWECIELNASDQRNEGVIRSIVGPASTSSTFNKKNRLIVLDEADNIHGKEDKGGTKAITELVKRTSMPVILIANDLYKVGKGLRQSCKLIRFYRLRKNMVFHSLRRICDAEEIRIEDETLHILAQKSNGDLRSAINDLQAVCMGKEKEKEIRMEDVITGERDLEKSIFAALDNIFRGYDVKEALFSIYNLDNTPEEIIKWIYENLGAIYDDEDVAYSLHYLSRADEFLERARREENFLFWRYASSIMTCGVLFAKMQKRYGNIEKKKKWYPYHKYQPPWHRRSLEEKESTAVKRRVVKKIAQYCKVSQGYARSFILPFLKIFFKAENRAASIASSLQLGMDEIKFLIGGDVKRGEKKAREIYERMKERGKEKEEEEKDEEEETKIIKKKREKEVEKEEERDKKEIKQEQKALTDFF